jgi:dynein heavy chain
VVWGVGSTLVQDSKEKFNEFFRVLIMGNNKDWPRPESFKLNKNQLIPEKGTVFDYIPDKRNNQWVFWMDMLDRESLKIDPNAKV